MIMLVFINILNDPFHSDQVDLGGLALPRQDSELLDFFLFIFLLNEKLVFFLSVLFSTLSQRSFVADRHIECHFQCVCLQLDSLFDTVDNDILTIKIWRVDYPFKDDYVTSNIIELFRSAATTRFILDVIMIILAFELDFFDFSTIVFIQDSSYPIFI
jgi:hypothetical protein